MSSLIRMNSLGIIRVGQLAGLILVSWFALYGSCLAAADRPITTDEIRQRGLVSLGDSGRLRAVLEKAARGESITVAAIGGSITAGGLATKDPENRYVNRVAAWFRANFPKAKVHCVNAGIGGTNSYYGAMRLKNDLLAHRPDLVVVEYAVNNFNDEAFSESYEGLLRQLLREPHGIAVIELFFMHKNGQNAQQWQQRLGAHYQLPMVSFRDAWWPELSSQRVAWESLYADVVHPNDTGHILASELLIAVLEKARQQAQAATPPGPLPAPLISDCYADCSFCQYDALKPVRTEGWQQYSNHKHWEGSAPGSWIEFEFSGRALFAGCDIDKALESKVKFSIDGGVAQELKKDAHRRPLAQGLAAGRHQVRFEIVGERPATNSTETVRVWGIGGAGLLVPAQLTAAGTVWELNVEKLSQSELVAATAMQGLANRDSVQVFVQSVDRDWMITFKNKEYGPTGDVLQKFRSVDDAWKDYLVTKHGCSFKPVAGLAELLEKVRSSVKGVILYDEKRAGELVVAVTMAGLRDALPVTESLRQKSDPIKALPVLEDLRGRFKDRLEAHQWAIKELLPQCSRDGAFSFQGGIDAISFDIAVARKMFVYQLEHLSPEVCLNKEQREKFEKREHGLNPPDFGLIQQIHAHLNPLSPIWGWGGPSEETFLFTLSKNGHFVMCAQVPNISVLARLKATGPLRQRHLKPEEVTVEPKHYIAFMVNEGDTIKCSGTMMMCGSWLQSERGQLPVNWGVNPYLCEQFPGMMEFYYQSMTPNDYFFDGPNGFGYMAPGLMPKELLPRFAERTEKGNRLADTRIADIWYFYPLKPDDLRTRWLASMKLDGLTQWQGPQKTTFPEGCPPVIHSNHYYDKGTPEEIAARLKAEAEGAPKPWFTVVYGGSPRKFLEISKQLPPDRFKIVRLDELFIAAAKSRADIEGKKVTPAPEKKPTP